MLQESKQHGSSSLSKYKQKKPMATSSINDKNEVLSEGEVDWWIYFLLF